MLVCRHAPVDLREVRRWSINEGMKDKYELFKEALSKGAIK